MAIDDTHYHQSIVTPIGQLRIIADNNAITALQLEHIDDLIQPDEYQKTSRLTQLACKQVTAYFTGDLKQFDLPIQLDGTMFQQQVWQQLQAIPYGETVSYGQLAELIGNKRSVRAVGAANGKNPIPIIVPCHRVIASTGKLQGFALGLNVKRDLLTLEQIHSDKYLF